MKSKIMLLLLVAIACDSRQEDKQSATAQIESDSTLLVDSIVEGAGDYESLFRLESYITAAKSDTAFVQEVNEPVALFVVPTAEQASAMEQEFGEDFYTIADDASYYQAIAMSMIDSLGVKSMRATKPFIKLNAKDTTYTLHIRKAGLPEWNIIFLHPDKEPEIIQAIQLTEEKIKSYFNLR